MDSLIIHRGPISFRQTREKELGPNISEFILWKMSCVVVLLHYLFRYSLFRVIPKDLFRLFSSLNSRKSLNCFENDLTVWNETGDIETNNVTSTTTPPILQDMVGKAFQPTYVPSLNRKNTCSRRP